MIGSEFFTLHKQKDQRSLNDRAKQSKNITYNFSSYSLTKKEVEALSYGLDRHIPNYTDRNTINTKTELLFQKILKDVSNIPEETLTNAKAKLRSFCEKYYNTTSYKYEKVISTLSRNSDIKLLLSF